MQAHAPSIGKIVYASACLLFGMLCIHFRDFAAPWQPVPSPIPGRAALVGLAAIVFILSGAALLAARRQRTAAIALALLFGAFALFWFMEALHAPKVENYWSGIAEQLVLVLAAAALALQDDRSPAGLSHAITISLGICLLLFGITHFVYLRETAALVPHWIPGSRRVWAVATGLGHCAGLAILTGGPKRLAALMLAIMFALFELLVWLPMLVDSPNKHQVLGGNIMNLALTGAVLIQFERMRRPPLRGDTTLHPPVTNMA